MRSVFGGIDYRLSGKRRKPFCDISLNIIKVLAKISHFDPKEPCVDCIEVISKSPMVSELEISNEK